MTRKPVPRPRAGKPESFGYVRASAQDDATCIAYERPNGSIAFFRRVKGMVPWITSGHATP